MNKEERTAAELIDSAVRAIPNQTIDDGARRIARRLGVSARSVHAWRLGHRKPHPKTRVKIQRWIGIPVQQWEE